MAGAKDGKKTSAQTASAPPEEPKKTKLEMERFIYEKVAELRGKYCQQGPFVYELYGVMIHSGGAHGGHYSAYIKDTEGLDASEFKDRTP